MMAKYLTGGQQTTINSTITELFPALAFNNGFKPKNGEDLGEFIKTVNLSSTKSKKSFTTPGDVPNAEKFILDAFSRIQPRLLKEKLDNAFAITNYIYETNDSNPIKNVFWGYRIKPKGVPSNHPGDIFFMFKDSSISGISLKAGTEKSAEPLLNTYVRTTLKQPYYEKIDSKAEDKLKKRLWENVYSKVGAPKSVTEKNYYEYRGKSIKMNDTLKESLIKLYENNLRKFDELYIEQNKISREQLVKIVNKDVKTTKEWIMTEFRLQKAPQKGEIPLILVKAVGAKAEEKGDPLVNFIDKVTKVKAYLNKNSVQEWFIDLMDKANKKLTLKMTNRRDAGFRRSSPKGKLGKLVMLKLQYAGVKK